MASRNQIIATMLSKLTLVVPILSLRHARKRIGVDTIRVQTKKKNQRVARYLGGNNRLIQEQIEWEGSCKKLVILKNGNHGSLRPVKIAGKDTYAIMTCAFDSVFQALLASLCKRPTFQDNVSYTCLIWKKLIIIK